MKTIVAGNWKMNLTVPESLVLVSKLKTSLDKANNIECIVCPAFTSIPTIANELLGSFINIGAQNMSSEESGAYTGEVSGLMLKDYCNYVILGHSERRLHFGETDQTINKKVLAALNHGISPILCVGENKEQRESGNALAVCFDQLVAGLSEVPPDELSKVIVAYEPIWAIGTGMSATPQIAQSLMNSLRNNFSQSVTNMVQETPFLYGGSVTPDNINGFLGEQDINGALVGGASLNADSFISIIESVASSR